MIKAVALPRADLPKDVRRSVFTDWVVRYPDGGLIPTPSGDTARRLADSFNSRFASRGLRA